MSISEDKFADNWEQIYSLINSFPSQASVNEWKFPLYSNDEESEGQLSIDIWPVLKMLTCMRATKIFRLGLEGHVLKDDAVFSPKDIQPLPSSLTTKMVAKATQTVGFWPSLNSDLLFLPSKLHAINIDGMHVCNHVDALRIGLEDLGYKTISCYLDKTEEEVDNEKYFTGANIGFSDYVQSGYELASLNKFDFSLGNYAGFEQLVALLDKVFPMKNLLSDKLARSVLVRILSLAYCFVEYFKREKLKGVFLVCYYGVVGYAAVIACRKLGIPVFDVQHGVQGKWHESYYWKYDNAEYNTLPSRFLCWSDIETNVINQDFGFEKALTIGNSWQLMHQALNSSDNYNVLVSSGNKARIDRTLADRQRQIDVNSSKRKILFTLQPDEDVEWLEDTLKLYENDFDIFFRLHPQNSSDEIFIRQLEVKGFNVQFATKLMLSELLPVVDLVLCHYSSTAVDALHFGVPVISYGVSGEYFFDGFKHLPDLYFIEKDANKVLSKALEILSKSCSGTVLISNVALSESCSNISNIINYNTYK